MAVDATHVNVQTIFTNSIDNLLTYYAVRRILNLREFYCLEAILVNFQGMFELGRLRNANTPISS